MAVEGGCSAFVASLVTAGHLDRDATKDWHIPVPPLSLQHSAREVSACYTTDKIASTRTLLRSYKEVGAPYSHGKATYPFSPCSQGLGHTGTPGACPSIQVTVGKTLLVAYIALGLVTFLGQDG